MYTCQHPGRQSNKDKEYSCQMEITSKTNETGYKYLGIIKGEEIKHQKMKEKMKYVKRLKAILKSKLDSGNTVKAIST